jgi:hypothetical protein
MRYWWRNRYLHQAASFMKRARVRERGGVWGNALQPVVQSADIHGSCGHDMLEVGTGLSNVARTPQAHPTGSLDMYSCYACPPSVRLLELFSLLLSAGGISCKMRFLSPHGEASSLGLRTLRTHWTGSTDGKTKLDFDDLLIACPGGCPTATGLSLWTTSLFVFPVNREIA